MQNFNSYSLLLLNSLFLSVFFVFNPFSGFAVLTSHVLYVNLLVYLVYKDGVSALTVILITGYLYLFSGYLDIYFFSNQRELSLNGIAIYMNMGLLFFFFICVSRELFKCSAWRLTSKNATQVPIELKLLISMLLVFLFYKGITSIGIAFFQSRSDNYEARSNILTLVRVLLSLSFIWLIAKFDYKKEFWFLLVTLVGFFIFEIVFLGDRRILLSTAACIFVALYNDGFIRKKHIVAMLFLVIFLLFFSWIRNAPPQTWIDLFSSRGTDLSVFSPMNLEFSGASIVAAKYYDYFGSYITESTLVGSLINILPGSVYALRETPPAVGFVEEFYPNVYAIGGTYAYSIVVDATANFGILGVFIFPLVLVFYISCCYKKRENRIAVLYAIYLLVFVWRMELFSIFKIASLILIIHLFLYFIFSFTRRV